MNTELRLLPTLFICLLASQAAIAQPEMPVSRAATLFDEGTEHLRSGQFERAIQSYSFVEEAGWRSPALYHNMAVAHFRMDDLARAVLYLERARTLVPDDHRILHSLSIAESRRVDTFSSLPDPLTVRAHRALLRFLGPGGWFTLGYGLFLVASMLFLFELFRNVRNDWARRARSGAAVLSIVMISYAFLASARPADPPSVVVLEEELVLREQPDGEGQEVQRVHEALVADIVTDAGNWTLIELPNGTTGWVSSDGLARI